ncbi:MAG: type II toxin-antitoxin system RelE/ParE family toxin [Gammaproteobacteria bacterium]|jgi:proteic killer suppression protein|nr:type II toxin-antitoxin system RelE/ParE family toxin [Gammaproteobacteria bacterium]
MIRSFRHKGLERFFREGNRRGIDARQAERLERMLDRLDAAKQAEDMNLPGYGFHGLKGNRKGSYAISVSGNLRMTFRFKDADAIDIDLEDYH